MSMGNAPTVTTQKGSAPIGITTLLARKERLILAIGKPTVNDVTRAKLQESLDGIEVQLADIKKQIGG